MGSSSVMVVVAGLPVAVPPSVTLSATLICTLKVSPASFRSSPATVRVKVLVAPSASLVAKLTVPVRSVLSTKSAFSVVPWVTVQVTVVAEAKAVPARVMV